MPDPKETLLSRAPLVDFEDLRKLIVYEIVTEETRSRAENIWITGSFSDPEREIDSGEAPSDLDILVNVPGWELPPADTGIPLVASSVDTPPIYERFPDEYTWESKGEPISSWDCSAQEAWEQLPEYAQETLMRSVEQVFHATEADVENNTMRSYDVNIGNQDHYEHNRCPRADICIWEA